MRVITTTNNVLSNSSKSKIEVDPGSLIQTYELNDYLNSFYKGPSFLDATNEAVEPGGVSNLQVSPEVKGMLKDKFWRTWYHLKHVQAGPFAVYNNPTPIDINGLFPATPDAVEHVAEQAAAATIGPPTVAGVALNTNANNNLVNVAPGTNQVQVVPGVGPVSVVTQAPATAEQNKDDELNRSLNAKAVPTNLPVTTSPSGDPNTPPLANIPLVNVIGGKIISAPGVIPGEHMDNHPLFSTTNLDPTGYYKLNVENIGRTIIVVLIVLFLVGGCVYRIKTRKRPKKKKRFFSVNIPIKKLQISTSRSSGPGGQSVNKSETKVQIRFNVQSADWLTDELKEKFLLVNKNRISHKGDFIVECDDFSNQHDNKKGCIRLLREAIKLAEEYSPDKHLTFLEQIQETKTPEEILKYKLARRESRRKTKQIGHKKLDDF